jgi:hypothetical protein
MSRSIGAVNYARGIDQGCCVHNLLTWFGNMLVGRVRVLCYDLHEAALSVPYLLGQFELCDLFHFV